MAFGQSPTTTTEGALPSNQIFISSVATPNTANGDLTALEGGPVSTDSNGNKTAPASMYVKDGNDVAQGTTTDATWSGSGAGTVIAILKKLVAELTATLAISGSVSVSNFPGTQPVNGTVTANQGGTWSVAANAYDHNQPGFIFKPVDNISITSGSAQPIWTPTSGKKFRLMGWSLFTTNLNSGTAIILKDGGTEFARIARPQTNNYGICNFSIGGNGYLSTTTNNVLGLDIAGVSPNNIEGYVYGFEE